jgi:hypothetical protein
MAGPVGLRRLARSAGALGFCVLAVAGCGTSGSDEKSSGGFVDCTDIEKLSRARDAECGQDGPTHTGPTSSTIDSRTSTSSTPQPVPFPTRPRVRPCVPSDPTTTTTSTTTTTTSTTLPPRTTTTLDAQPACSDYKTPNTSRARSWATFERRGVRVSVHRVPERKLTIEITSSDGKYDGTRLDPDSSIYDGLELTTSVGFDWVWDVYQKKFVLKPGQVRTVLRVYDCWSYVDGPSDLF